MEPCAAFFCPSKRSCTPCSRWVNTLSQRQETSGGLSTKFPMSMPCFHVKQTRGLSSQLCNAPMTHMQWSCSHVMVAAVLLHNTGVRSQASVLNANGITGFMTNGTIICRAFPSVVLTNTGGMDPTSGTGSDLALLPLEMSSKRRAKRQR